MLFKRIDRYVTVSFLSRALACALLLLLLYVSFDVLSRLEDMRAADAPAGSGTLVAYYANILPLFLVELLPGIVLAGAGMVVVTLARSGELMALKACGTSVHRVVAPIFFWTLVASAAVSVFREVGAPGMMQRQQRLAHVLEGDVQDDLLLNDPQYRRHFFIRQYDFVRGQARDVAVIEQHPGGALKRVIQADSAVWRDGTVQFTTAEVREFGESGLSTARPELLPELSIPTGTSRLSILAAADEGSKGYLGAQTLGQLRHFARMYPGVPYFRVAFHARLASFFSPFILLLVGIPCLVGFEHSVQSRFLGVLLSIALATGLFALTFVFTSMGTTGTLDAVLAGWLPTVLAGALGLWLFESMLT